MLSWLFLVLPLSVSAVNNEVKGVAPTMLSKYVPQVVAGSAPTWKCLDGSANILWSAVNDDYCDCPDGSDEPGTSACPNSTFYCRNEGHIGATIPGSRVNDGLCEPECCDGSDERPGACENICQKTGEAFKEQQNAEQKLRKTGSKIRSSYIAFAQKEKKRIEGELAESEKEITIREKEVARLKDLVDRTESLSAVALEQKKQSPLYQSLLTHHQALKSLQHQYKKEFARSKQLEDILDSLRRGYNPNYQDMAVLEAVRGYEFHAGLPHINDVKKDDEGTDEEGSDVQTDEPEEELEEGMWTAGQLEHQLDDLLDSDYETLLLEHEKHIGAPTETAGSLLFDITAYLPDAFIPQYEALRDSIISVLELFGVAPSQSSAADTSRMQKAHSDAEHSLNLAQKEKEKAEQDLRELFDVEAFGREGEWKKLDNTCLELDAGEYTYEICLFNEARQKPSKGGASHSLGKFQSWNDAPGVEVGSPEYYSKMRYAKGAKCWNGPFRSVTLLLSCSTDNALLTVAEPEKCEYEITGTSPALCLPLDDSKKDEL